MPQHLDCCVGLCCLESPSPLRCMSLVFTPLCPLLSLLSPSLKLILLSVLPGRRYLSALFISSQIFIQATSPLHQAQGIMLCSLSFLPSSLPHSYLSFHSSASHFTYMFMQNHASNLLDTWLQRLFQIKRTQQHQIFK